jgi:hypothetical protein
VDATLAKKTKPAAPAATKPGLQVQQGGKAPATEPEATPQQFGSRGIAGMNESKVEFYSNFLGKML